MTPDEEKALQEAYYLMLKATGLKKGDKVRVLRKTTAYHELGWYDSWAHDMDASIGQVLTIVTIGRHIKLSDEWNYPWFVLELVESVNPPIKINLSPGYDAIVTKEQVVVGRRVFTLAAMDDLAAAVAEVRKQA